MTTKPAFSNIGVDRPEDEDDSVPNADVADVLASVVAMAADNTRAHKEVTMRIVDIEKVLNDAGADIFVSVSGPPMDGKSGRLMWHREDLKDHQSPFRIFVNYDKKYAQFSNCGRAIRAVAVHAIPALLGAMADAQRKAMAELRQTLAVLQAVAPSDTKEI